MRNAEARITLAVVAERAGEAGGAGASSSPPMVPLP
jgi:hypothetical protein